MFKRKKAESPKPIYTDQRLSNMEQLGYRMQRWLEEEGPKFTALRDDYEQRFQVEAKPSTSGPHGTFRYVETPNFERWLANRHPLDEKGNPREYTELEKVELRRAYDDGRFGLT